MADGDRVDPPAEIVRYARPSDVSNGILDGTAFARPEKDKDGLSVTRLGYFANSMDADLAAIRAAMIAGGLTLKPKGKLAQIAVADIEEVGALTSRPLCVVEDHIPPSAGSPGNLAHCLIKGLPFVGAQQGDMQGLAASDRLAMRVQANMLHPTV